MNYLGSGTRHVLTLSQGETNAISSSARQRIEIHTAGETQAVTMLCGQDSGWDCPMTCGSRIIEGHDALGNLIARNMVVITDCPAKEACRSKEEVRRAAVELALSVSGAVKGQWD